MSQRRRVAITGLGLVTPVGNDVASTWHSLLAGRSGAAAIASFDASGFPVRIAAEVKALDDAAVLRAAGYMQIELLPGALEGEELRRKIADVLTLLMNH